MVPNLMGFPKFYDTGSMALDLIHMATPITIYNYTAVCNGVVGEKCITSVVTVQVVM